MYSLLNDIQARNGNSKCGCVAVIPLASGGMALLMAAEGVLFVAEVSYG